MIGIMIGILFAALLPAPAVTLEWDPSPDSWVSGYAIHYGTASGVYTVRVDVGNVTTCTITNLTPATTYYFVATAYTADGLESLPSNEVAYTVPYASLDGSFDGSDGGEVVINSASGIITAEVPTLRVDPESVYWSKGGLSVTAGQVITLWADMRYQGGDGGDGLVSIYLVDEATGIWLAPERVRSIATNAVYYQTDLIVRSSSDSARLYVCCGILPGSYEFSCLSTTVTTPSIASVSSLYLKQLLPRQVAGLNSAEWTWSPAAGSQGYIVRTATIREEIEKGAAGILFKQESLPANQFTYRLDIPSTLYGGVYLAVSSLNSGGYESVPWITWYLPGDIFNTADEAIPPLCYQGMVDANDVNYAYTGYTSLRRVPALTPGWPAGREERTDIDSNGYAGRVSDYSFIRSQYLNSRRMR